MTIEDLSQTTSTSSLTNHYGLLHCTWKLLHNLTCFYFLNLTNFLHSPLLSIVVFPKRMLGFVVCPSRLTQFVAGNSTPNSIFANQICGTHLVSSCHHGGIVEQENDAYPHIGAIFLAMAISHISCLWFYLSQRKATMESCHVFIPLSSSNTMCQEYIGPSHVQFCLKENNATKS